MSLHFWIDLAERLAFTGAVLIAWSYLPQRLKTRLRRWNGVIGASVLGLVALVSIVVGASAALNHEIGAGLLMLALGAGVAGFAVQIYRTHPLRRVPRS